VTSQSRNVKNYRNGHTVGCGVGWRSAFGRAARGDPQRARNSTCHVRSRLDSVGTVIRTYSGSFCFDIAV